MKEIWNEVVQGYQVSTHGRVRNVSTGKILRLRRRRDRYLDVHLRIAGRYKRMLVHRMVAAAFLKAGPGQDQVNHINGVRHDNMLENLEWVTQKENARHAVEVLGRRKPTRRPPLTDDQVAWIKANYVRGSETYGCKALARKFGVTDTCIYKRVRAFSRNSGEVSCA